MSPRPCLGRRSDCHGCPPAKISTPPSTMVQPSAFSRHVRELHTDFLWTHTSLAWRVIFEQCTDDLLSQISSWISQATANSKAGSREWVPYQHLAPDITQLNSSTPSI